MKKTLAVDATWLMTRQFHVVNKGEPNSDKQDSVNSDIKPDTIITSFLTCLLKKIRTDFNFQCETVLLWDRGTYRYRPKTKFVEYKEERTYTGYEPCWDAIKKAFPLVRLLGFKSIQIGGLEADDLGMFYSHNRDNCVLWSIDSDWRQSITKNTKLHVRDVIYTYDDVCKDEEVETPFDLAIKKAICGEHDNLKHVGFKNMSVKDAIQAYKTRQVYTENELIQLDYNLNLSRLDRILTDTKVIKLIHEQEKLTKTDDISYLMGLAELKNMPQHLRTSLNIYHTNLSNS